MVGFPSQNPAHLESSWWQFLKDFCYQKILHFLVFCLFELCLLFRGQVLLIHFYMVLLHLVDDVGFEVSHPKPTFGLLWAGEIKLRGRLLVHPGKLIVPQRQEEQKEKHASLYMA